jgi:hypothetical protein
MNEKHAKGAAPEFWLAEDKLLSIRRNQYSAVEARSPVLCTASWQPKVGLGSVGPRNIAGSELLLMKDLLLQVETVYRGVPSVDYYGLSLVGPSILQFGTEKEKRGVLPPITRG